jgi:hypothetical protein
MSHKAFLKIQAGLLDALAYAKRRRYSYVVYTVVNGEASNIQHGPIMGVHSNFTAANKHFEILFKDRKKCADFKLYWDISDTIQAGACIEMRKAYMKYRSFTDRQITEQIVISRWSV